MPFSRTWTGIVLGLLVGAVVGFLLLNGRGGHQLFASREHHGHADETFASFSDNDQSVDERMVEAAEIFNDRTNAIVLATRKVAPAVVSISVLQQQQVSTDAFVREYQRRGKWPPRNYTRQVENAGSGVIVSANGMIVTNSHVVESALQIIVTLSDGRQFQAVVLDRVPRYDLAILRIQAKGLPVARIASDDSLQIGEWAIAIGSPFGDLLADTQPSVTVGVISAVNRDLKGKNLSSAHIGMIQTDAAINPGNSGGPLVNTRGEVIGINTFILSDGSGSVGIGFAVPSPRVMDVVREVVTYGHYREPGVGFLLRAITPLDVQNDGLVDSAGAYVYEVREGEAGWLAGLRDGDIIRKIEGLRLNQSDAIYRLYYDARVGDSMIFTAERDGEEFDGAIVFKERSEYISGSERE
ncbi:MAG: serine protease Do [Candidatus Krumholzibacteriia bacterium]